MGILHPKKALYNKVYRKTTFGGISGINQSYSGKSKTIQYEYHEVFLKEHRVNKLAYCLLAFFLGSIGGQYFYMKEFKKVCYASSCHGLLFQFSLVFTKLLKLYLSHLTTMTQ